MEEKNTLFLKLTEIAAWQISDISDSSGEVMAELPALQRGAVWKVLQTEMLWDSILRNFPIGAFTLSASNPTLLRQDFLYQQDATRDRCHTHLLLDGQQRSTAIALAFDDIWSRNDGQARGALWVDIGPRPDAGEAQFVFRVLTRAHPWGYRRNNPRERLPTAAIRSALCAFQAVHKQPDFRPEDFSLCQTWPWDAMAPVPVAPIVRAVLDSPKNATAALGSLWKTVQAIPFLSKQAYFPSDADQATNVARSTIFEQQKNLVQAFEDPASTGHEQLKAVISAFDRVLCGPKLYYVPALILDIKTIGEESPDANKSTKDAIELLFIRLNSAGTPLAGEELVYSLIKAEWPEVASWMQSLKNKPALPSRISALIVRLVMARHRTHRGGDTTMPGMPTARDFRLLLSGKNPIYPKFRQQLIDFINNKASSLLEEAWRFCSRDSDDKDFRLLPGLTVDIAQNSPDVFLLLLRWIDRLQSTGIAMSTIIIPVRRRTLGFLTALAWFAPDKARACAVIWPEIEADVDNNQLVERFNATRFGAACKISDHFEFKMIPLPTPEDLAWACERFTTKDGRTEHVKNEMTVDFPRGQFWTHDNWWYEIFVPTLYKKVSPDWVELFPRRDKERGDSDNAQLIEAAVQRFLDTLWNARSTVLIYAQSASLQRWYPNFDPS